MAGHVEANIGSNANASNPRGVEAMRCDIRSNAAWGENLGYHLKTGHTLSVQNRPTALAEDVIVLPCSSVRLQGLGLSPRSGV